MSESQLNLFEKADPALPDGFAYASDVVPGELEGRLLEAMRDLPFKEFEFQQFLGKRRVVSFGWQYDFKEHHLRPAEPMPPVFLELRDVAARFGGLEPEDLPHVLVTEYGPGAAIGWHRDRSVFGDVVGISLLSPCRFRLRRKDGARWERAAVTAEPRSAYLLRGPARTEWEHSIPAVDTLRYSATFRTLRPRRAA
jgi:alkylated DNA repair dioxygenase AlkB